jgi:hypothetical protein
MTLALPLGRGKDCPMRVSGANLMLDSSWSPQ